MTPLKNNSGQANNLASEVRRTIKEWYPTFSTHWEKTTNCPCKDCFDYRLDHATTQITDLMVGELEKLKEDSNYYFNSYYKDVFDQRIQKRIDEIKQTEK